MTFPLTSTPFVLLDKVIREMKPMDSLLLAFTSTRMQNYMKTLTLRKMEIDIHYSKDTTVIKFQGGSNQAIVMGVVPGECPFTVLGTCVADGDRVDTDAPLSAILNVLFKVVKVKLRNLKIFLNEDNQYEELVTGLEGLVEKRFENLELTTRFSSERALEPPAFLDGFTITQADLNREVTRLPNAIIENIYCANTRIQKMIEFYQQWKTASMDHVKLVYFSTLDEIGDFFEAVGAWERVQEERMDEDEDEFDDDDQFHEIWEMARDNGDIVEIKMAYTSFYATVKSDSD